MRAFLHNLAGVLATALLAVIVGGVMFGIVALCALGWEVAGAVPAVLIGVLLFCMLIAAIQTWAGWR
jgi:hypothetical protein